MLKIGQIWVHLESIDKKSLPFGLNLTYRFDEFGIRVTLFLPVKDRKDRSKDREVMSSFVLEANRYGSGFQDAEELYSRVYSAIERLVLHEVAESFVVNGVILYDPHKEEDER